MKLPGMAERYMLSFPYGSRLLPEPIQSLSAGVGAMASAPLLFLFDAYRFRLINFFLRSDRQITTIEEAG